MFNRTLVIHKALFVEDDVSINITTLQLPTPDEQSIYESEGKGIAQALMGTLPASTIVAMMAELERLQNA